MEIREEAKILICTGFSESISEDLANALGIKGILMKPVTMWDLAAAVRSVLDEGSLRV